MKNCQSIVVQRRQQLLKILRDNKYVDVEPLAQALKISPTTVRRDLTALELKGLIQRYHGGAQLSPEASYKENTAANQAALYMDLQQQLAIARYAATLIEEGDVILMNATPLTLHILDYLQGKQVTIVTNNPKVIGYPHDPRLEIILTGGSIHRRPDGLESLTGAFAQQAIAKIMADKVFLGADGISTVCGITTTALPEAAIDEQLLQHSRQGCHVLATKVAIGCEKNFCCGALRDITTLITCTGADQQEIKRLRQKNLKIIEIETALEE